MRVRSRIILTFTLFLLLFSCADAQTRLTGNKIPEDLLITLKGWGSWGHNGFEINIAANGDWSAVYKGSIVTIEGALINEKPVKYLKPHLTKENLKTLIDEFEKIQFFRFGKDFPQEDQETALSISDNGTDIISIRINGKTKEIYNYLGDYTKRARLLKELAAKIRGAGVWNFEKGKIPEDLAVSYRISYGRPGYREFTIKADGRVFETSYSNMPSQTNVAKLLQSPKESKLKTKLSKERIKQLISEFEKVDFSEFVHNDLTGSDGCTNENITSGGNAKSISVRINGKNIYVSTHLYCNPQPETNAAKFEYLVGKIEEILKTVKATKVD